MIVAGTEPSTDILVIQDLDLEGEVLLQILNDHDEEGELNAEGLVRIGRASNVVG